jgi:hypothetical protein
MASGTDDLYTIEILDELSNGQEAFTICLRTLTHGE